MSILNTVPVISKKSLWMSISSLKKVKNQNSNLSKILLICNVKKKRLIAVIIVSDNKVIQTKF